MKQIAILLATSACMFASVEYANSAQNTTPQVAILDFSIPNASQSSDWISDMRATAGTYDDQIKGLIFPSSLSPNQGSITIVINREIIHSSMAIALVYEDLTDTDFSIQLLDANNHLVTDDFFQNGAQAAREAKTDTFILPLEKYPDATQIVIRRISGSLVLYKAVLYPVLSQLPTDMQRATFEQLNNQSTEKRNSPTILSQRLTLIVTNTILVTNTVYVNSKMQNEIQSDSNFLVAAGMQFHFWKEIPTNYERASIVGGPGGTKYAFIPSQKSMLVGFRLSYGDYSTHKIIKTLQPIFSSDGEKLFGPQFGIGHGNVTIEAKAGYAVNGIEAKAVDRLDGMRIWFAHIKNDQTLDASDVYCSEWFGGSGGTGPKFSGFEAKPSIGIYGRAALDSDAFGLLYSNN